MHHSPSWPPSVGPRPADAHRRRDSAGRRRCRDDQNLLTRPEGQPDSAIPPSVEVRRASGGRIGLTLFGWTPRDGCAGPRSTPCPKKSGANVYRGPGGTTGEQCNGLGHMRRGVNVERAGHRPPRPSAFPAAGRACCPRTPRTTDARPARTGPTPGPARLAQRRKAGAPAPGGRIARALPAWRKASAQETPCRVPWQSLAQAAGRDGGVIPLVGHTEERHGPVDPGG